MSLTRFALKNRVRFRHVSRVTLSILGRITSRGGAWALCASVLLLAAGCQGDLIGPSEGAEAGGGSAGQTPMGDLPRPATFSGPIVSTPTTSTRFVRLNHTQWENSVKDALKASAPLGLSKAFVAEPLRSTFDTNGSVLSVSADTFRDYQLAAESLASTLAKDPTMLGRFTAGSTDAITFIKNLGKRAFRRPLRDAEVTACKTLFDKGAALVGSGDAFADGVELVAGYLFQSPHFIYREELSSAVVDGKVPLGSYEVASKLAYALTNSMPDDTLLGLADQNALASRDQVIAEIKRILATPAAAAALLDFHDQLLVMREFETITKRDTFPGFTAGVGEDLKQEGKRFISDVVFGQDKGFHTLMSAPYTFANQRIRGLYGLDQAGGSADFTRLDLDPSQRAGVLTQIGFLAANAEQDMPNIIIRGVHIARKIMCAALPPPPNNVPPLPALQPNMTNRQRVELATKESPCNGCHTNIINPLGMALENLDGVGKYRTVDNGQAINAAVTYNIDGKDVPINGAVELANAIASSDQAHACYAQHWAEYLYGRVVTRETDNQLVQQGGWLSHDKESAQNLIINLLATDAFLTRLP
jgi:hypothetical protein